MTNKLALTLNPSFAPLTHRVSFGCVILVLKQIHEVTKKKIRFFSIKIQIGDFIKIMFLVYYMTNPD